MQLSASPTVPPRSPNSPRRPRLPRIRPAAELAAAKPHGTRIKYVGGCRCDACRAANTTYARARRAAKQSGDVNGVISADKAREHLRYLQSQGLGRRAVSECTDLSAEMIRRIRRGQIQNIRARTERLILAVRPDMASDGARIDAGPTLALVRALVSQGVAKQTIARGIGRQSHKAKLGTTLVTVRSAYKIERLHALLCH